jgi:hypothetical protein
VFGGLRCERLHAHVVNDEEVGPEVALEGAILFGWLLTARMEVAGEVEDGSIKHKVSRSNRCLPNGLREMTFTHSGRADEEQVAVLADELAGGQRVEVAAHEAGLKAKIESIQASLFPEVGLLMAAADGTALAHVEFVLEEKFEELSMRELMGGGFMQTEVEALHQTGETELAGLVFEAGVVHDSMTV